VSEIAIAVLVIILLVREIVTYRERKDLLDRLMSRDFTQYKDYTQKEEANQLKEESTEIPLEEAQELIEKELHG